MRSLLTILVLLLLATGVSADGSFGTLDTAAIPARQTLVGGWARGSVETSDGAGTLDSVRILINHSGVAEDIRCALYLNSDSSLIDTTEHLNFDIDGVAILKLDFIDAGSIADATDYLLIMTAEDGTVEGFRSSSAGAGPVRRNGSLDFGVRWTTSYDPFPGGTTFSNLYFSFEVFWSTAVAVTSFDFLHDPAGIAHIHGERKATLNK